MKTFLKISDDTIINVNNIVKITKTTEQVYYGHKHTIRYYINNTDYITQFFIKKEERDTFFTNICSDLMY